MFMIFPANPTTITTNYRHGKPFAHRVEHPALDGAMSVPVSDPSKLSAESLDLFHDALNRLSIPDPTDPGGDLVVVHRLSEDLAGALAELPDWTLGRAGHVVDAWNAAAWSA